MVKFALMRRVAVVTGILALLACYASTLHGMAAQWWNDEDMGHGFLVPIVALWIVWREPERWRRIPLRPSWVGVAVILAAGALHAAGALGGGLFIESVALVLSIAGLILLRGGFPLLRAWGFPLLLLLFMLPKLAIVYNQVTLPLQLLATRIAGGMLSTVGFSVIRDGNILDVKGHRVSVVEACNGIRYLLPLAFLAVVFAYLAGSKVWMRVVMLACAVPIAILANALRVAVVVSSPALAEGMPHRLAGAAIFVLCLAGLGLVYRWCRLFYVSPA